MAKATKTLNLKPKSEYYMPEGDFKPHRESQHQTIKHHADNMRDNKHKLIGKDYLAYLLLSKP